MIPTLIKFKSKFDFEFFSHRKKAFVFSFILILSSFFCVFYKNLNELSEKILRISRNDKTRRIIGKNGKDKYLKYFNQK